MSRNNRLKSFWVKYKLTARLKVLVVVCCIVMFVTPLRNALVPWWPFMLREISTFKVIHIYLVDLFYYVDRTTYDGPCDFVHSHLQSVKMPKLEDMPVYDLKEWFKEVANLHPGLDDDYLVMLDSFKPSLTLKEQQTLLFTALSATQALAAFNITYFISDGSLIGYWRHHGIIPWDDDSDMMFDREQWPLARKVLSCLPDLELNMGSDYMWKLYHKQADLWLGDPKIRFPYVDLFMYRQDNTHIWPVCIWMKTDLLVPIDWVLPVSTGVFEGYPVHIPRKTADVLYIQSGNVASDCYSRTFMRRERQLVPVAQRFHMQCSLLKQLYPFVVRTRVDKASGTVIEERTRKSKILSTFNTSYQGTLE